MSVDRFKRINKLHKNSIISDQSPIVQSKKQYLFLHRILTLAFAIIITNCTGNSDINISLDDLLKVNSEAELISKFNSNTKRSIGYLPEGMGEYPNTILFAETKNEVEFVWNDTIKFENLNFIRITKKNTDWKTKDGITIGTSLIDLEKLNGKPFKFLGFDFDGHGWIFSWENGSLHNRKLDVYLDYNPDKDGRLYDSLTGDQQILSNSKFAQKANPIVQRIELKK